MTIAPTKSVALVKKAGTRFNEFDLPSHVRANVDQERDWSYHLSYQSVFTWFQTDTSLVDAVQQSL
jgi:hypothetical protein